MKALRTLWRHPVSKPVFQFALVAVVFLPYLRVGIAAVYLLLCVIFGIYFVFLHSPAATRKTTEPGIFTFLNVLFYFLFVCGILFFTAIVYWENSMLTLCAVFFALPFLLYFSVSGKSKERQLACFAALVIMEHLILFYFPDPLKQKDYEKILRQKYVTPVFLFYNGKKPSSINGVLALPKSYGVIRTLYVDLEEKNLYCILHGPPVPHVMAMKFPVENLRATLAAKTKFRRIYTDKSEPAGARDMAVDGSNNTAYILGINGTVFKINMQRFQVAKKFHTGMERMVKLYIHHNGKNLLVLSETGEMHDYSLPEWKSLKSADTYGNTYAFLPVKNKDIVYVVQWGKNTVAELNLNTLRLSQGLQGLGYYPVGADINEEGKIIYFTDYFRGELMMVDIRDLEIADSVKIERGLREARWDARRKLLYMGNFQKGTFYVFDPKQNKILKKLFLGKKLRHIYITPKTHQVLVATRYGVFSVDIDGLSGRHASEQ